MKRTSTPNESGGLPKFWRLRRVAAVLSTFGQIAALCPAAATEKSRQTLMASPQTYCANVAAGAETMRMARKEKLIAEMETQLREKIQALEAKEAEVRGLIDRINGFQSKANDALVLLYSSMKADAAATQIAELDIDTASALLIRLKPKISSAILNEIDAARGAALAKKLASLGAPEAKHP